MILQYNLIVLDDLYGKFKAIEITSSCLMLGSNRFFIPFWSLALDSSPN